MTSVPRRAHSAYSKHQLRTAKLTEVLGSAPGNVTCSGCTRCCHGGAVRILPGDDPSQFELIPHSRLHGELMLKHKPNGDCIYLGEIGCTIHERRPRMCREMDCRLVGLQIGYTTARKLDRKGILKIAIWRRGRDLLDGANG